MQKKTRRTDGKFAPRGEYLSGCHIACGEDGCAGIDCGDLAMDADL
jgi:hypothetical protein